MQITVTQALVSFIAGLTGAIVFTFGYNHLYHQAMGTVRIDEIVADHIREIGKSELTQEQMDAKAKAFGVALEQSINSISGEYKVTLLVAPAVVTSIPDYTAFVKSNLEGRLGKND